MRSAADPAIILDILTNVCSQFSLSYKVNDNEPVELSFTIPKQENLSFEINLSLQNDDELWLCLENFTMSVFPVTSRESATKFIEYLSDLISGKARVVEYLWAKDRLQKSVFQTFDGQNWETVSYYRKSFLPNVFYSLLHIKLKENIIINEARKQNNIP